MLIQHGLLGPCLRARCLAPLWFRRVLDGRRIPAGDIEGLVLDRLRALFASEKEVGEAMAPLCLEASMQRAVLNRLREAGQELDGTCIP